MVVHANGPALLAVVAHGIGAHGQDGQAVIDLLPADGCCGLIAVHDRHLQIHQDQIIAARLQHGQRLLAVLGQVNPEAFLRQQLRSHLLIDLVVLNQENARPPDLLNAVVICRALFSPLPVRLQLLLI